MPAAPPHSSAVPSTATGTPSLGCCAGMPACAVAPSRDLSASTSACPHLFCATHVCVPSSFLCHPRLHALIIFVPPTSVCPHPFCAIHVCMPSSFLCHPRLCALIIFVPPTSACPHPFCATHVTPCSPHPFCATYVTPCSQCLHVTPCSPTRVTPCSPTRVICACLGLRACAAGPSRDLMASTYQFVMAATLLLAAQTSERMGLLGCGFSAVAEFLPHGDVCAYLCQPATELCMRSHAVSQGSRTHKCTHDVQKYARADKHTHNQTCTHDVQVHTHRQAMHT